MWLDFDYVLQQDLNTCSHHARRKANLSNEMQPWIEEVALDEQGHVRMIREVLGERRYVVAAAAVWCS